MFKGLSTDDSIGLGSLNPGGRQFSLRQLLEDPAGDVFAALRHDDLSDFISDAESSQASQGRLVTFVNNRLPRLVSILLGEVSEKEESDATAAYIRANARDLLNSYISYGPQKGADAISRVVPSVFAVFSKSQALHPSTAASVSSVITTATRTDLMATISAVAITLDPVAMHGMLRHCATNTTIMNLVVALVCTPLPNQQNADGDADWETFQSTLFNSSSPSPTRKRTAVPNSDASNGADEYVVDDLTMELLNLDFPLFLSNYVTVAMATPDGAPYFQFVAEVVRRGLSVRVGPLVDKLLEPRCFDALVAAVVDACCAYDGSEVEFPLAPNGVQLLINVMSLLRNSIPPTENKDGYELPNSTQHIPIKAVLGSLPKLSEVISSTSCTSKAARPNSFGRLRMKVIALLSQLVDFGRRDIDDAIMNSGIIGSLLDAMERFPTNNIMLQAAFSLLRAINSRTFDESRLMLAIVETHSLCTRFIDWFDKYPRTPLHSLTIQMSSKIGTSWSTGADWVMGSLRILEYCQQQGIDRVYKGADFHAVGSAQLPKPNHLTMILAAGVTQRDLAEGNDFGAHGDPTSPVFGHLVSDGNGGKKLVFGAVSNKSGRLDLSAFPGSSSSGDDASSADRRNRYASVGFGDDDEDELPHVTDVGIEEFYNFDDEGHRSGGGGGGGTGGGDDDDEMVNVSDDVAIGSESPLPSSHTLEPPHPTPSSSSHSAPAVAAVAAVEGDGSAVVSSGAGFGFDEELLLDGGNSASSAPPPPPTGEMRAHSDAPPEAEVDEWVEQTIVDAPA